MAESPEGDTIKIFDLDLQKRVHCDWYTNVPMLRHAVIEGMGVAHENLEHEKLMEMIERFCVNMKFSIVDRLHYQFTPYGKSIVFVLEESHVAVHSWPERGYIHMDIVTCTPQESSSSQLVAEFNAVFSPENTRLLKLKY
ncbi:hypothetical protein A3C91_04625 [Candidatus Azambacteria bacterium RIFCSPHIGHO2_02_FULL_52_12]|uniref:S-adenosylmethionine decarboxylase proenzyme n=1 Tax=Candidatus Azambacteria bacterium RIFCSPLOWO2_01_FULL_46_25 TaxID=1797298 RepID=A0A1F5BV47_9BACT|nr:MAG: hypothetical protein A3C91_04625 [Candidatus Azambacteria bacterium RIFCSPHIGHO2_02_FULL_52_12]OGD34485.1 MAG: hypothetical protein A2988_03120 [Candidatus Azambacteria bacterium RIFCSPLOWO2_01_FULL_46_25]OGD38030.1 MAG: hypothetical protein A2850_02980 [Candidatus Azambacteria bacterium RIFCSPHIGHO2_01_FULL_51_74]